MSVIDRIKSAQAADTRIRVEVARWNATLFFRPLDPRGFDAMLKKHPKFREQPTVGAFVDLILMRAENEDGSQVFDAITDRVTLMGEPINLIDSIASQIMPKEETAEEIEKN